MMRKPEIIVAQVSDKFSARLSQAFVIRFRLMPTVGWQVDPAHSLVTDRFDDFLRVIRAAIADHQHFEVGERLPESAANGVRQDATPVISRNNGSHCRRHCRHAQLKTCRRFSASQLTVLSEF